MSAPQEQNAAQPVQAAPGDREASTQVSPATKAHASSETLHARRLELHNTPLANREKRLREEAPPTPDTDEPNKLPPPRGGVPSVELDDSPPPRHRRRLEGVATTIPTRGPEIETIPTFEGKSVGEHQYFQIRLEIAFRIDPAAFDTEDRKIAYTLQHLTLPNQQMWIQHRRATDSKAPDWSEMMTFLLHQLENPIRRELQVTMQYTKARQGENKSVTEFAAYLTTLESQITPPYEDRHLQMHLYSRLLLALRTAVANYHEFLHTRQDLVYRASTLEEDLQRSSALPLLQPRDTSNAQN
ncbi:hypothetical protein K504DRAFT_245712 [Pleomassaria siparia CBS 279.74]|uniref:Retrotransposon gag domain-containing protein n=1 Tax=Pleomassaria siparia CBS 279.74 TaxID=1314801 RepID=A0A6G1JPG2_9PLEO|nr:hypothetical protein K504DRAFT_245712 [Pleomassaria siparia CBS 279.74]